MKPRCFIIGVTLDKSAVSSHFNALGQELARRGHKVILLSSRSQELAELHPGRVDFSLWPSPRPTRLADAVHLWHLIDQHRPDCLVANFASVNWMCIFGWLRRVPCRVAWYHTLSSQLDGDGKLSPWLRLLLRFRKTLVYTRATHLAANSLAAMADLERVYRVSPRKCRVWRNALADPVSWLALKKAGEREDLLVCAGRFDWTKGQDVLIKAIGLAQASLGSTKLEFHGAGPMLEGVRQQAQQLGILDRCTFRGSVPHEEVIRRMSCAKLTVTPSRSEAFGLVNIESMAVGTPVVASRVGGITEIIHDGVDGFLVPPEDAHALADKILTLLKDPALCERMGENARNSFLREFEQSQVVNEQADWLEQLTAPAA